MIIAKNGSLVKQPEGLRQRLKCLCVALCLTIRVILMADLAVVRAVLEQQICVLGIADPSHPQTLNRLAVTDK